MKSVKVLLALLLSAGILMSVISCTSPNTVGAPSDTSPSFENDADATIQGTEEDGLVAGVIPSDQEKYILNNMESWLPTPIGMVGMGATQAHGLETQFSYTVKEDLVAEEITVFGMEYTYERSMDYWSRMSEDEYGSFYSSYDQYKREDGAWLSYISGTGLMARYTNHNMGDMAPVSKPLTTEDAKNIADDFLKSILPEDVRINIPWSSTSEDSKLGMFFVGYGRRIHGYITDEDILVGVNSQYGVVEGYNGVCVGKYAALEPLLTKELLDETAAKLEAKVLSLGLKELSMKKPSLTTNTDGDVYMALTFDYFNELEGITERRQILHKVEIPAS